MKRIKTLFSKVGILLLVVCMLLSTLGMTPAPEGEAVGQKTIPAVESLDEAIAEQSVPLTEITRTAESVATLGTITPLAGTLPGTGAQGDPYKISTQAQLADLSNYTGSAYQGKYFELQNDITLTGDWTSVGSFQGIFDGKGFTISNFNGNNWFGGLFSSATDATIKDLNIVVNTISGNTATGGLAALATNATITNCHVSGTKVQGSGGATYVGGLLGEASGTTITGCSSTVLNVTGSLYVGGLVGSVENTTITNSHARSIVTSGGDNTGGLVGRAYTRNSGSTTITNCYATGDVTSSGDNVGGLVGNVGDGCSISGGTAGQPLPYLTYASGNVSGRDNVGGLVGLQGNCSIYFSGSIAATVSGRKSVGGAVGLQAHSNGELFRVYANGDVTATETVGGLVGTSRGPLDYCTATGSATGTDAHVGGLVGWQQSGNISFCSASGNVSGGTSNIGGLVGWQESGEISDSHATGNVSGNKTIGGLVGMQRAKIESCYATGNVTATGSDAGFEQRFFIGGLVGAQHNNSTIENCYATGKVSGKSYVGGLLGVQNWGSISQSFAGGNVSGTGSNIGGLAGGQSVDVIGERIINNSYALGDVAGNTNVGGFLGISIRQGDTQNCYALGNVSGTGNNIGGFVGEQSSGGSGHTDLGKIGKCFAAVQVTGSSNAGGFIGNLAEGTVTDCFFDKDTAGRTNAAGSGNPGIGILAKTTLEMTTKSTYTGAGWVFSGSAWGMFTKSGDPDYGYGYPYITVVYDRNAYRVVPAGGSSTSLPSPLPYRAYDSSDQEVTGTPPLPGGSLALSPAPATPPTFGIYSYTLGTLQKENLTKQVRLQDGITFTLKGMPLASHFSFSPASATYDGNGKPVNVTSNYTQAETGAITIFYYNTGTSEPWTMTAPIDAGTYAISINVAGGSLFDTRSAIDLSGPYTIQKATPTVTTPLATPDSLSLGSSTTLSCTVSEVPDGTDMVEFFAAGTSIGKASISSGSASLTWTPTTNGSYSITAKYLGSANYNEATSSAKTVTVLKPITGIAINEGAATINVGSTTDYTATVSPTGYSTTNSITWQSSNTNVATVDSNGQVTAVAPGNANITASIVDGDNNDTLWTSGAVTVTVKEGDYGFVGGSVHKIGSGLDLVFGTDKEFILFDHVLVDGNPLTNSQHNVKSGSTTITMYAGYLDTLSLGDHTLTVEFADGWKKDVTFSVIAADAISAMGVTLDKLSANIGISKTLQLTATVAPTNATNKGVTWSSSNTSIAMVDADGKVTGLKVGTATVTVTTDDGGHTATCKVTVTEAGSPQTGENSTIAGSPQTGENSTIMFWLLLGLSSVLAGLCVLIWRKWHLFN